MVERTLLFFYHYFILYLHFIFIFIFIFSPSSKSKSRPNDDVEMVERTHLRFSHCATDIIIMLRFTLSSAFLVRFQLIHNIFVLLALQKRNYRTVPICDCLKCRVADFWQKYTQEIIIMAVFTLHCKIDWLHFSIVTAHPLSSAWSPSP